MSLQGNGCHFPLSFHLVDDKGNHGEVKFSGRRVEMKGQFNPIFEFNVEFELIQVDCNGVRFGISRHLFIPSNLIEKTRDLIRTRNN